MTEPIARTGLLAPSLPGAPGCTAQAVLPVDRMGAFWAVFDAHAAAGEDALAGAIRDGFMLPQLADYTAAGVGSVDFGRWAAAFLPLAEAARGLSQSLPALWQAHAVRFARALPDAAPAPVVLLPSFFCFDARVRVLPSGPALFLAPDGIVRIHGATPDIGILLDHESFRLYHHQVNAGLALRGGDPLWLGLWKAGLAVHACAVLRPCATRRDLLRGDDALAAIDGSLLRRLVREVLPLLDFRSPAVRERYLACGYRGDIPARSGYALGLVVAARAASERGLELPALARMPVAEVDALMRAMLATMAG